MERAGARDDRPVQQHDVGAPSDDRRPTGPVEGERGHADDQVAVVDERRTLRARRQRRVADDRDAAGRVVAGVGAHQVRQDLSAGGARRGPSRRTVTDRTGAVRPRVRRPRPAGRQSPVVHAPYVIAEIGCNHGGDLELAKRMISVAARFCEVDAVKFQKRDPATLLTPQQYQAPHPEPRHAFGASYGEHREFLEFDIDQHAELARMRRRARRRLLDERVGHAVGEGRGGDGAAVRQGPVGHQPAHRAAGAPVRRVRRHHPPLARHDDPGRGGADRRAVPRPRQARRPRAVRVHIGLPGAVRGRLPVGGATAARGLRGRRCTPSASPGTTSASPPTWPRSPSARSTSSGTSPSTAPARAPTTPPRSSPTGCASWRATCATSPRRSPTSPAMCCRSKRPSGRS